MTNERRLIEILKKLKQEGKEQAPPDKIGISPAQVNIIDEIFNAEKITIRDLADNLKLTPPTISVGVKKLEAINLIKRESHSADGRIVLLILTEGGVLLYKKIEKYRIERVRGILNRLNSKEQAQMLTLLEKALN